MKWAFWTRTQPATPDDCGTIDPLLSLYADGMASAEEARRVETHLPDCAACRESLAWTQATQRALAARPVASPPADLRARIAAALAASSAAPVPASITVRRAFALRPAYAAAASLTILGVAVSYGLLHTQAPLTAKHGAPVPPMVAALPTGNSSTPVVKHETGPGVKAYVAHHPAATPKSARLNPDLMARNQPDEAPPEPVAVKTHTEAKVATRTPADTAPVMVLIKPRLPVTNKPNPNRAASRMMASSKPVPSLIKTHKLPVVKPEVNKPDAVVAVVPHTPMPSAPAFIEKQPIITRDPAPTVVGASAHEGHARTADLLRLGAYVGQMKSFTHNTVSREAANGATYAARTLDLDKTPGIDFVHGPTH